MALELVVNNRASDPPEVRVSLSGTFDDAFLHYARVSDTGVEAWTQFAGTASPLPPPGGNDFVMPRTGCYFFYAVSTGADGVSSVVYTPVTDGIDPVLTRIRAAIAGGINLLPLGLQGVYPQWTPDQTNMMFPCVILTHENASQTREDVVVGTDDIGHGVRVMICDTVSRYDHEKMPDYDFMREQIWRRFSNQRLLGVPEVKICTIEPDIYSNQDTAQYEFMVSEFVIRCHSREPSIGA